MMYRCIDVSQHVPIMFNVSIMFHIANRGYQGEVGLLSRTRTITVSSEVKDSELTDPDPLSCTQGRLMWGWLQRLPVRTKVLQEDTDTEDILSFTTMDGGK